MKNKITISIPEPCHANWDEMNPTEKGKFCLSCQKEVIDFTAMTDAALYRFFNLNMGKDVCGHTLTTQLNTAIAAPVEPKKKRFWYVNYLVTLLLLINKSETKAQTKPTTELSPVPVREMLGKIAYVPKPLNEVTISGRLVAEDKTPIAFATVQIKGTRFFANTDSAGNFSLAAKNIMESAVIMFSRIGFMAKEISFGAFVSGQEFTLNHAKKQLKEVTVIGYGARGSICTYRGGAVSVMKTCTRPSITQKIVDTISGKNRIKVFPNPAVASQPVHLDMKGMVAGTYNLQLLNTSGAVVQQNQISIPDKLYLFELSLKPSIVAGTYFLQVVNGKNMAIHKSTIVVL